MMLTVLFINIPTRRDAIFSVYPPVGVLSMAAFLKENGYSATFIDADLLHLGPDDVAHRVAQNAPRIVGISLTVGQVAHADAYITAIQRRCPTTTIVVGGPYVSGVGERIFSDFPTIGFAVVKEGEHAIVGLAAHLEGKMNLKEVKNLLFRYNAAVCQNATERILDIERLPTPDYTLVRDLIDKYQAPSPSIASPSMIVMCTRGCPYECTFCSSPTTWDRRVTFRSTESVIKEIVYLRDAFNVHEIFFQDDTLNARPAWLMDLCDKIIECGLNKDIYYKCPFRANQKLITAELLNRAKQANFWMIFYGVESGNEEMLRAMKKEVTVGEIRRAFRLTREAGILSYASFMVGNTGENRATVHDSLRLLDDIRPDFGGFAVAVPFPGSEMYLEALRRGHILQLDFRKYQFGECILRTEELTPSEIFALTQEANAHFNRQKNALWAQQKLNKDNLAATIEVVSCPATMRAAQIARLHLNVGNRSNEGFSSVPPFPVNLAYHWKDMQGAYSIFDGQRTGLSVPLRADETRPFTIEVVAPEEPGTYSLEITMVQENHLWFELCLRNLPLRLDVTVEPG
jgi:anaerobic magnesium-protoporphyrin IX monomethyl ester cyclase